MYMDSVSRLYKNLIFPDLNILILSKTEEFVVNYDLKQVLVLVAGHPAVVTAPAAGSDARSPPSVSCPVPPASASTGPATPAG